LGAALAGSAMLASVASAGSPDRNLRDFSDPTGLVRTVSTNGAFDTSNPFFQNLGTNGRTCATCHVVANAMGLSPAEVQDRFNATNGLDPIFRTNDGSNSPTADVSTLA